MGTTESGLLSGTVDLVEPLGAETLTHISLDSSAGNTNRVTVRAPGLVKVATGDAVGLTPLPGELRLFDTQGAALPV